MSRTSTTPICPYMRGNQIRSWRPWTLWGLIRLPIIAGRYTTQTSPIPIPRVQSRTRQCSFCSGKAFWYGLDCHILSRNKTLIPRNPVIMRCLAYGVECSSLVTPIIQESLYLCGKPHEYRLFSLFRLLESVIICQLKLTFFGGHLVIYGHEMVTKKKSWMQSVPWPRSRSLRVGRWTSSHYPCSILRVLV